MSSSSSCKLWRPAQFTPGERIPPKSCAVVILNQPLENKDLLVGVCSIKGAQHHEIHREQQVNCLLAKIIVCADGGANRLRDLDLNGEEENACVGHQAMTPSYCER